MCLNGFRQRIIKLIYVRSLLNNNRFLLTKSDKTTAPGSMPPGKLVKVGFSMLRKSGKNEPLEAMRFEDTASNKHGEFCLGLRLSRELIERYHGTIGVDASSLRGACFTFQLPVKSTV